jgi:hypothetical protein
VPPRPPAREPHVAWPLKVLAVLAVGGALVAGYREVTGGDEAEPDAGEPAAERAEVERTGSDRVGDTDRGWRFDAFPESYRITYRVRFVDAESTEVLEVVAPFDSRTTSYAGASTTGRPTQEREAAFGLLVTRSGDQTTTLQVPPALAGPRPAAALAGAEEAGLVERREVREVAGRRCQVWRTGGAQAATTFVAPTDDDHFDLCVDEDGLLLEEWQVDGGVAIRQRVAVDVEVGTVTAAEVARLPRESTLPVDLGGGSLVETAADAQPVGPFLEVGAAPAGFTHRGRFTVVPPQAGLLEGGERAKVLAATTDVYVRGADAVIVERGGVLDLSDPWTVNDAFPDVDLGPAVGTGELVPGRTGGEVRALLGSGRYLRVSGSIDLDELVAIARDLVPVDNGSGIGFGD